jgi:hypothetical protein
MKPTYTPGPWNVVLVPGSYQRPWIVQTPDGKIVATGKGDQLEPDATSIREATANAALIASAPVLLELLDRLSGFAAHYASDSAMKAGGADLVAQCRAAIAKATGGGT